MPAKLRSLSGFGLAFVATMIMFEFFCRASGSGTPAQTTVDEDLGVVWKAGSDLLCLNEGFRIGRINEYGYLGPAYPPEKPDGVIRIALMGDSYVVGRHLFDRHHFRNVLEEKLNESCSEKVQVLNLGLLAANFERMYIYHEMFAQKFAPDYVVYLLGTHNLNRKKMEIGPKLAVKDGSLVVDYSFRTSTRYKIRKKLAFLRESGICSLIRRARALHIGGESPRILLGKFGELLCPEPAVAMGKDMEQIEDPSRKDLNRAILRSLAEMNSRGSPRIIIVCRDGLPEDFIECIKKSGIAYFDPGPELNKLARSGIDPHYWKGSQATGHWNQYAHRVVGEFLAEKMRPLIEER
jgi:hypothetical protein